MNLETIELETPAVKYTHYTYITILENGQRYIGKRKIRKKHPTCDGYFGSPKNKCENWKPVRKVILGLFTCDKDAIRHEMSLHKRFDVARNPKFYNKARQRASGFSQEGQTSCWKDIKGKNNPFSDKTLYVVKYKDEVLVDIPTNFTEKYGINRSNFNQITLGKNPFRLSCSGMVLQCCHLTIKDYLYYEHHEGLKTKLNLCKYSLINDNNEIIVGTMDELKDKLRFKNCGSIITSRFNNIKVRGYRFNSCLINQKTTI